MLSVHIFLVQAVSITVAGIKARLEHISTLSPTSENADYSVMQIERIRGLVDELLRECREDSLADQLHCLQSRVTNLQSSWISNFAVTKSCTQLASIEQNTEHPGGSGRPRVHINMDLVELLRSSGYTWSEVADALMVSRTTLWRRVRESGVPTGSFTDISDEELDAAVRNFRRSHPHCGQVITQGYLNSIGISVQRYRVRNSIARVDPYCIGDSPLLSGVTVYPAPIRCGT